MFKKRGLKGNTRSKAVKHDSDSSEEENDLVVRKKTKVEDSHDDGQLKVSKATDTQAPTLTRNEMATKVDLLNQEIIDRERSEKEQPRQEQDHAADDGTYKGQNAYASFLPAKSSKMDKIGPKKASSNIRSTTVFDFARDECKDFKETGFCGYGDSCKFVHARDDFKAGWKLNKDWELLTPKQAKILDTVPFKCPICKQSYKSPIKTKCGHYFCEACFLVRCKKTTSCLVCGENTEKVAMPAKDLKTVIDTAN